MHLESVLTIKVSIASIAVVVVRRVLLVHLEGAITNKVSIAFIAVRHAAFQCGEGLSCRNASQARFCFGSAYHDHHIRDRFGENFFTKEVSGCLGKS